MRRATARKAVAKALDHPDVYCTMAVLCQSSLEEKNGMISIVRVVDEVTTTLSGLDAPLSLPAQAPRPMRIGQLVLMFRSGSFVGEKRLSLRLYYPSGQVMEADLATTVLFPEPGKGVNILTEMVIGRLEEGQAWIEVCLDDVPAVRIPVRFKVVLEPEPVPEEAAGSESSAPSLHPGGGEKTSSSPPGGGAWS